MPERDVEEDGLEGSVPIFAQHFLAQARRPQTVAKGPDKLGELRHVADKEQRQEFGLVDDLVQPKCLDAVETWPFKEIDHFGNNAPRQIAGRSQLQTIAIGCTAEPAPGGADPSDPAT